ncbi:MAG: galactokinase [Chthoniobacterales bacterium]
MSEDFLSFFAPGRVEVIGNHVDYNGGVVLSAALQLGIRVKGRQTEDGTIRLASEGIDERVCVDSQVPVAPLENWADYPLGVWSELKKTGAPVRGFEAEFSSTLPIGAGLSSSAAIESATAMLLQSLYNFKLSPLEIAKICQRAENQFVGVNCGLLDQVSSVFGRSGNLIVLDCRSEEVSHQPLPGEVVFIVVHSAVPHALVGGEYNERREQCFEAARLLGVEELRDVSMVDLEAAISAGKLPDLPTRRARHVVGEVERVFAAKEAALAGDLKSMGSLMTQSHRSSIHNFENSTPELDMLVEIATADAGVYGARLTGGGFGGAIVALAQREGAGATAKRIETAYRKKSGNRGKAYVCEVGDGAVLSNGGVLPN